MSSFSCCSHLRAVSRVRYLGGHHPECPSTQELQAEVRRLQGKLGRVSALAHPVSGERPAGTPASVPRDAGEDDQQ